VFRETVMVDWMKRKSSLSQRELARMLVVAPSSL
jgi:hypothetical protein